MELYNGLPLEEIQKIILIANSYVERPAIQEDFIVQFSEEVAEELQFSIDLEKRIVTGPLMIPDLKIFRKPTKNKPARYVYYTADTIKETALDFHRNGRTNNTTVNHNAQVEGSVMVESWFVTNPKNDKLFEITNKEYPIGTWAVSEYISDDNIWEDVKSGKLKGFSIEGYETKHDDEIINKNEYEQMDLIEKIKALINGTPKEEVVVENKEEVIETPVIVEDTEKIAMASELEVLKAEKIAMESEVAKLKSDLAVLMAKVDEPIVAPKSNDKYTNVKEPKSGIPSLEDVLKNVDNYKNKK